MKIRLFCVKVIMSVGFQARANFISRSKELPCLSEWGRATSPPFFPRVVFFRPKPLINLRSFVQRLLIALFPGEIAAFRDFRLIFYSKSAKKVQSGSVVLL